MQNFLLVTKLVIAGTSLIFTVAGCALNPSGTAKLRHAQATSQLANGGQTAKDIYYACLLNGLAQGLPLAQIKDECAVKLGKAATRGLPGADEVPERGVIEIPLKPKTKPFDPSAITAACEAGDGTISQKQTHSDKPVMYRGSEVGGSVIKVKNSEMEGHGYGSYGGYGKTDPEDNVPYQGLSKEESMKQKAEAIKEAKEALEKYQKAQQAADKEQDPDKKKQLQAEADKLQKEWTEKHEKAHEDPNKKPKGSTQVSQDPSECEQALEYARELLYECHRTQWGSASCKDLEAKMSHCPDPTQIYVDPEAGYSCVVKIDTEALVNAWVASCETLKRFDPSGGGNPCRPPTLDGSGRYVANDPTDAFCKSGPDTYVTPDVGGSTICLRTIDIKPYGEPDFQKMIVWGLDKFGGPIVVIATKDPKPPSPKPGPEPRPAPTP
jgi:hypothetical protein